MVYVVYLLLFGLAPFTPIDTPSSLIELYAKKFQGFSGIFLVSGWDIWTNILLFTPYGLLVVAVPAVSIRPWWFKILLATASAALLSFALELGQLLLPRHPSFADVVCNTIGAIGGALVGCAVHPSVGKLTRLSGMALHKTAVRAPFLCAYLVVLYGIFSLPVPLYFANWDPDFTFQLGNEGTLDRPWRGNLYLVALYERALTDREVRMNHAAGSAAGSFEKRTSRGLLHLYDFSDGGGAIVHDRAAGETAIDLAIQDQAAVQWIMPNGLTLHSDTIVSALKAPVALPSNRFASHNELSVEAWIASADLAQSGPARIVSYSQDANHRNFTLGQQQGNVVFRLRTPISGPNGTQPELMTSHQPLEGAIQQHLVATFRDGVERLYVDGIEQGTAVLHARIGLIDVIVSLLGQEFKVPLWSAFMCPLGMLTYLAHKEWHRSGRSAWIPFLTASTGLAFITGGRLLVLKSSEPSFFIMIAASNVLLPLLIAPVFLAADRKTISLHKSLQQ
jgi:hypothetical protein